MPYGGKPSGGCFLCRQRKVKCDEKKNGCGNCARIRRTCPGYRKKVDIIFRYENESVAKRSADAEKKGKESTRVSSRVNRPLPYTASLQIPRRSPLPNVEDLSLGSFFAHFVAKSPRQDGLSTSEMNSALLSAIKSVGLAGVSRSAGGPSLTPAAQSMYIQAIATTNRALCSAAAVEDGTLLAVMLLGMFETMTGCTKRSMEAWRDHINGAAALLKVRGAEQLKSVNGRNLFVAAASSLMIECLRQSLPLPGHIHEITTELRACVDQKDPVWRFLEAGIFTVDFLSHVWQGKLKEYPSIVLRALELDILLQLIFAEAPCVWEYKVVSIEQEDDELPGHFHIYNDYRSAQLWNSLRVMRLLLHEVICNCVRSGSGELDSAQTLQIGISTSILHELHIDILATVPQHLGHVSASSPSLPRNYYRASLAPSTGHRFLWSNFAMQSYTLFHDADVCPSIFSSLHTFGGYALPWGLYLLGRSRISTSVVRTYVGNVLRRLGNQMGILQALYLAEDL